MEREATDEDRREIERRVIELRKALDKPSSDRRILYLGGGLYKLVASLYGRVGVETFNVLDEVGDRFTTLEAARIIFDAEEVEDGNGVGID